MFTLSELSPLNEPQVSHRLLKPWWEVFMDYLVVLMLMLSVLAGTLLLSRDGVVCLPSDSSDPAELQSDVDGHSSATQTRISLTPVPISSNKQTPDALQSSPPPHPPQPRTQQARRMHLDFQQYVYISHVCYQESLPWYSRFFPYVALLQSLLLLASGCFWFHFPRTSARIEHFIAILGKCAESPWTSRALSRAAQMDATGRRAEEAESGQPLCQSPSIDRRSSLDSGTDSLQIPRSDCMPALPSMPPSPCPSTHSCSSSLSSLSFCPISTAPKNTMTSSNPQRAACLDPSDGEQARALFERVRKFRTHCEASDIIFQVYRVQTLFKVLLVMLILSYTAPLLESISFSHTCQPQAHALTGYSSFQCTHRLAPVLCHLVLAYMALLGLFGLLGICALRWICHRSLRRYSFQRLHESSTMQDVPDLCNDLAFLLHMADQYDPLLAQRLLVFLSPVSETCLLEESLEKSWGIDQLRSMTRPDAHGRSTLQLVALPRLPPALFSLSQVEVLKLELITDAKLPGRLFHMTSLRELHLYHCTAEVDPAALAVLRERLDCLHLTFSHASEMPAWMYALRGLQELHLSGRLSGETSVHRGWALGSLRQLRHLRVLVLRSGKLQRLPGELGEVAGSLTRLEVHNEGTHLLALTGLRRLGSLEELTLHGCQLERLPSALLGLAGLRGLDVRHNCLRTLEELLGLQHLRRLAHLRLAHNRVLALPASVGALRGLELLDLSHNQLRALPPTLFTLRRLRRLQLASNQLEELSAEVGALSQLVELDLSANQLAELPPELFSGCPQLCSLSVAHNSLGALPPGLRTLTQLSMLDLRGNCLVCLPAELEGCVGLQGGGLLVEDWLLHSLPPHVRESLSQPGTSAGSRPDSDGLPAFSTAQWHFLSESQI